MIIYRAFAREAARNTLAITFILTIVVVFFGLTTFLNRAVSGELAEDIVLQMLGLQTLKRVDLLLVLGFYLGSLLTVARWYRDSEMTVLAACGIGLPQMLRPTLFLTAIIALLVGVQSFYFTPWAAGRMDFIKLQREQQPQPLGFTPGVFNETAGHTQIFYAERVDRQTGNLAGVFMSSLDATTPNLVVARSGYPYTDERTNDRFLALVDGMLYEGSPGEAGYRVVKFETLRARLDPKRVDEPPPTFESMPTIGLLLSKDPQASAELHWRIAKPVMVLVLVLFALVLAHTDPRRGRLMNLFTAILVYFVYSNMMALGQTLLRKGQVPGTVGMWWAHGIMLVVAIYLFSRRAADRPLLSSVFWRRS